MEINNDIASEIEELFRDHALRQRKPEGPPSAGITACLFCGNPFTDEEQAIGKRWCDADCRDDWEAESGN